MVSQGAQTNGGLVNGRKLTKSYSEAGSKFGIPVPTSPYQQFFDEAFHQQETPPDHEPLQRTQSEEPPKSPYLITESPTETSPPLIEPQPVPREPRKSEDEESESGQKEIIIDFEPHISPEPMETRAKKRLLKTMSEGEILQERRKSQITDEELIRETFITSSSQENIKTEPERSFTPYFLNSPILHEDIFKEPPSGPPSGLFSPVTTTTTTSASTSFQMQESIDEEFHENLICGGRIWERKRSISLEDGVSSTSDPEVQETTILRPVPHKLATKSAPSSPGIDLVERKRTATDSVVPVFDDKTKSPFASCDSLTNDIR